jgi:hypothetical protein
MNYLTKTRFMQGIECPIKLTSSYKVSDEKDEFLSVLAEGGFQTEELSRLHYKNGILIEESANTNSVAKTNKLLKNTECTIYEAAFLHDNLFVRTDILVKEENVIKVIEVKAKSFDSTLEHIFEKLNQINKIPTLVLFFQI